MKNKNEIFQFASVSDDELCLAAQNGDGMAEEAVIKRYARLVKTCARPYFLLGADAEDILQEGMLGLLHAVREFDEKREVPFPFFAKLCITRKIYSAVKIAAAQKHKPLNDSMSIDRPLFEYLAESKGRVDIPIGNPETLVIGNEERTELMDRLRAVLSEFEEKVLCLFLSGYSYDEMAEKLGKSAKSIDNAIQRIKRKSATIKPI